MQGSNYQIDKGPLINIPIRQAVSDIQNKIILLAKNIIIKKSKDKAADVKEIESQIDQMVYKLYGLTDEEIKIIEGKELTGNQK